MKNLLNNTKSKIIIAIAIFIGFFIFYLNYDDGIYYVYKDGQYPFKTFPDQVINESDNDLNVHTKIVYPNNEDNTDYEIVDQSYLDGSELDRAEQSLSFEYNENIIEYGNDDEFIVEAFELLVAQSPTSQTYGIYEKSPISKEFVQLDNDFIILDAELKKSFYIQNLSTNQLTDISPIKSAEDLSSVNNNNYLDMAYLEPIDLESILRNSEAFTNNIVENEFAVAMVSNGSDADSKSEDLAKDTGIIYPLKKPDNLILPNIQSVIMDEFDMNISSEPVEFKQIYYGVQVSSVSSRLDANKFYEGLIVKYSNLLNRDNKSHKNLITKENLGDLGTWYKLRIGPFEDRSEAKRLCSSMRDEGLEGCIVVELE